MENAISLGSQPKETDASDINENFAVFFKRQITFASALVSYFINTGCQLVYFMLKNFILKSRSMPRKVSIKCISNAKFLKSTIKVYEQLLDNIKLTQC